MSLRTQVISPNGRPSILDALSPPNTRNNSSRLIRQSATENGNASTPLPSNSHLHLKGHRPPNLFNNRSIDSLDLKATSTSIPSNTNEALHAPHTPTSSGPTSSSFFVMITGHIESAQTEYSSAVNDQLYCRYIFSSGPDWEVVHGVSIGLSQIGRPALFEGRRQSNEKARNIITWNFPIEISFHSTNPHGWPRLALSVYGFDFLGRDVLRGYASLLLPLNPGRHVKNVKTFRPVSGSKCQQFVNWLMGTNPEYYDSRMVTRGEGRSATRVVSEDGLSVKVVLVVTRKDFSSFGYTSSSANS